MDKYSKNTPLQYGDALLIAKKVRTTALYVRKVISNYRKGKTRFYGAKSKKIIRIYELNQT